MNPLQLMALFSSLSGLGGLFGGAFRNDPFQQILRQMQQFANPAAVGKDTQQFYNQFLASPAFTKQQSSAIGGANAFSNAAANRVGQQGLGNTGIGAAVQSMGQSSLAPMMNQIYSGGYQGAQNQAMQLLQSKLQGLGMAGQPTNFAGGFLGAGFQGLGDVLRMMYQRMGQGGQGQGGQGGGMNYLFPNAPWMGGQ